MWLPARAVRRVGDGGDRYEYSVHFPAIPQDPALIFFMIRSLDFCQGSCFNRKLFLQIYQTVLINKFKGCLKSGRSQQLPVFLKISVSMVAVHGSWC